MLKELEKDNDVIKGDAGTLEQVLIAIIINAIEATPAGGKVIITSDYHSKKDRVKFMIRDTGKGIPDEVLPHIFDPLFSTKESEKSTGLGLSVVYGIIEQHGGSVEVESKVNQGSKFTVTLPRVPPDSKYGQKKTG